MTPATPIPIDRAPREPDARVLEDLVRRIVAAVHPRRIIIFGSASRREMHRHSDLDVLVIVSDEHDRGAVSDSIYDSMWGFPLPKDILVVTESDVRALRDNPWRIIHTAVSQGREIYRAA